MRKLSKYKWTDRRKINFVIDLDEYFVDVDVWVIDEPDTNIKYVDDIYINSILKNGDDYKFLYQRDIEKDIVTQVINYLEKDI
jgi:hypothetical protein